MGPVEISFVTVIVIFGIIGIVRGFQKELGVTTMLLLALFLIALGEARFSTQVTQLFTAIGGTGNVNATKALMYSALLIVLAFITYQGETLSFPGSGRSGIVSFLVGVLNGYLLAGSIWFYLDRAAWVGLDVHPPFTQFYQVAVKILPPAVLDWPFLIAMVALMLILRVWK